jgi:hypothetical protein
MSNVPDGAQLSDDGQWWWDAQNETWQPVEGGGGSGDSGGGGGGDAGDEGAPAFDFDNNGLLMSPENSPVESAGEPLKASFSVCNTGTKAGTAHVILWIDGSDSGIAWDSPELQPGQCTAPDDGYIHDIPGQSEGRHKFEVFADPPGPYGGWTSNEIDVGPAEDS